MRSIFIFYLVPSTKYLRFADVLPSVKLQSGCADRDWHDRHLCTCSHSVIVCGSSVKVEQARRQRGRVAGNKRHRRLALIFPRPPLSDRPQDVKADMKGNINITANKLQTRERLRSLLVGAQSSLIASVVFARKTVYVSIGRKK